MSKSKITVYDVNPFYVHWKKHFCPKCGTRLIVRQHFKTIDCDSPEADPSHFNNEYVGYVDEVLYCFPYFFCDNCKFESSLKKMKDFEKSQKNKAI